MMPTILGCISFTVKSSHFIPSHVVQRTPYYVVIFINMHSALCPLTPIGSPFSAGGPLIPKKGLRRRRVSRRRVGAVVEKPGVFNVKVSVFSSVADTKYAHTKNYQNVGTYVSIIRRKTRFHPFCSSKIPSNFELSRHMYLGKKTKLLLISPKNPSPQPLGSMKSWSKFMG